MISPETPSDILAEIARNLDRIATALESFNNAAIRHNSATDPEGYVIVTAHTIQS